MVQVDVQESIHPCRGQVEVLYNIQSTHPLNSFKIQMLHSKLDRLYSGLHSGDRRVREGLITPRMPFCSKLLGRSKLRPGVLSKQTRGILITQLHPYHDGSEGRRPCSETEPVDVTIFARGEERSVGGEERMWPEHALHCAVRNATVAL